MSAAAPVNVVGIGGAIRERSTSDTALGWMARELEDRGAHVTVFKGRDIDFPLYDPTGASEPDGRLVAYLEAVRTCDALILSTPVYHGGPSGLIKNAIDHLQPLMTDERPYLSGRAVCCIAAGGGLPGAVASLSSLRDVVHALRGWPTPMQVPINSSDGPFDADGRCIDAKLERSLNAALEDLTGFAAAMAPKRLDAAA